MPYVFPIWVTSDSDTLGQVNPNYESRYEPGHAPVMNGGIVIKTNANQRYTSNAQTTFLLRCIAKKAGVPVQEFEIRNDSVSPSSVRC
jgi:aspartyl aminopeptidase